jgi:hypothetical protein
MTQALRFAGCDGEVRRGCVDVRRVDKPLVKQGVVDRPNAASDVQKGRAE